MLFPRPADRPSSPKALLRWSGLAFVYWLACMTALEPGNVAGMIDAGVTPNWGLETLRLLVAGLLGASVTPVLAILAERAAVVGPRRWRNLALQAVSVVGLMLVLVVVSTALAAWLLKGQAAPSGRDVARELFANGLLLVACLAGFLAILQRVRPPTRTPDAVVGDWPSQIPIGGRGRVILLQVDAIDWIETQGNYQALHAGAATHLLRATSAELSARLDPARFARIHRRATVALDRVAAIEPLANGDGVVRLRDGTELRLTRSFRDALRGRLGARCS